MSWFFSTTLSHLECAIRRSQLARLLRFYADRSARHRLSEKAYVRLRGEIDQLVLKQGYRPADVEHPDIGYIFCPENRTGGTELLYSAGGDRAR